MKLQIGLVVIFGAFLASEALPRGIQRIECFRNVEDFQTLIYEKKIREAIEEIRVKLSNEGLPDLGIPPMDPLILDEDRIQVNNKMLNLDLNATGRAEGLLTFDITHLKMSLVGLKFEFEFKHPEITAEGLYGILAESPLIKQKIFGNGDINVKATDLVISGNGKLGTKLVHGKMNIIVDHIVIDVKLGQFDLKITGLFDDEDVSKFVSEGLSLALPKILQDIKDDINEALKEIVKLVNEWLIKNGGLIPRNELNQRWIHCGDE